MNYFSQIIQLREQSLRVICGTFLTFDQRVHRKPTESAAQHRFFAVSKLCQKYPERCGSTSAARET